MSKVYFNSLSGMMAASFGLKSVSNNVSNMQTTGYKGESAFYSAVGGNNSQYECLGGYGSSGNGVTVEGSRNNFKQGELESGNSKSQLAVKGEGLFILKMKNGEYCYTRDGEFHFNDDGYLVDDHSDSFVMGYSDSKQLIKISKEGPKDYPGKATDQVDLNGEIYVKEKNSSDTKTSSDKTEYQDIIIQNIKVFDGQGKAHELTLTFNVITSPLNKQVSLDKLILTKVSENNKVLFDNSGLIQDERYSIHYGFSNTYPDENDHKIKIPLQFDGCDKKTITFNFSTGKNPEQNVQLKLANGTGELTEVKVTNQSGYAKGKLYDYEIDNNGQLHYLYSNEQSSGGTYIALALFDDPQANLVATSNNVFKARSKEGIHVGTAEMDGYGNVMQGKLERSNVDSTHEFANIIILQRMFQACSQIMDIEKQLLEDMAKK